MKWSRAAVAPITLYLLGLLSLAAGLPKLMQMPRELAFLAPLGLSGLAVSILGCVQALGGLLLFPPRLRLLGALLAGLAFLVSAIALFAGGNTTFGLVSLLPLAALVVAAHLDRKARRSAG